MAGVASVSKRFGTTLALDDVTLDFPAGVVTGLVGENGAGKTTLMKIVAGVEPATSGRVVLRGRPTEHHDARAAAAARVVMVHQHFALVPQMTAAENLVLSREDAPRMLSRAAVTKLASDSVAASGMRFDRLDRQVRDLSVGEMARLELIKALRRKPSLLILDEPTSVLAPPEAEELLALVRKLAQEGVAVVLITHKLAEVFAASDRIAVLRRGALQSVVSAGETSPQNVARMMIGDRVLSEEQPRREKRESILSLRSVATPPREHRPQLIDCSIDVHRGEVVGVIGVAGNGQRELAEALRGIEPLAGGYIELSGNRATRDLLAATDEIGHVPPDRTAEALFPDLSVCENIALAQRSVPNWRAAVRELSKRAIDDFAVRTSGVDQPVRDLSGGNQQKVVLARELLRGPAVLVASEPTRGLDLEATRFVHAQLREAAARGAGVLLITSDLDEALALSDTIHVMYRGRLSRPLPATTPVGEIGEMMAGLR